MQGVQRITIMGLGLLGSSLAEAARKRMPSLRITGVSAQATLEEAARAGVVDETYPYASLDAAVATADLVFLCTPIDHIKGVLEGWAAHPPSLKSGCVVTDVGSTKVEICALGRRAIPPRRDGSVAFVGSHPMAGSEKTGIDARDPLLFENASWVLCPDADAPVQAVERLQEFVETLGARSTRMTSELHDRVAAHVSHLPQLLSTALAGFVGGRSAVVDNCLQIAGGGFRDMSRLAASSFAVWDPILRTNRGEVAEVLAAFRRHLDGLARALEKGDLGVSFQEGNRLRGQLSTRKKGFSAPLTEILVDLEDKPGTLLRVLRPLADRGMNVQDLEILKVREGEAGTLMMAFRRLSEAETALLHLEAAGFKARLR